MKKYEGHTPAPWKQAKPKDSNPRITTQFCGDEIIVNTGETSWEADIQLIADAPDLLAEVLRLREVAYRKDMQVGRLLKEAGKHSDEVKRLREKNEMLHSRCMHLEGLLEEWRDEL